MSPVRSKDVAQRILPFPALAEKAEEAGRGKGLLCHNHANPTGPHLGPPRLYHHKMPCSGHVLELLKDFQVW